MRARAVLPALGLLWLLVLGAGVAWGSGGLGGEALVLWSLRLPRILLALLVGGALASAGLTYQTLWRNPLAEPYTLGVASGAALGAVLALQWGPGLTFAGFSAVAAASFAGALAVVLVLLGLARRGLDAGALLLAGVAIALSCSAVILFLQYLTDPSRSFRMVRWMMGGLAVVGYREVLWLAPWVVVGGLVLWLLRRELDQMLTGEELAASRGVDVPRLRLVALAAASLMVGALVAVAGPIGFVGLVVPHVMRRLLGSRHGILLPACLLGGGAFLGLADLVARRLMAPAELPVGILTALLGGPFFLALMLRRRT